MTKLTLILSSFIILANSLIAQKLDRNEKKVVSIVDENMAEAISFLEKVVNVNSGTYNLEGVKKVGAIFQVELEALGFKTKWIDLPPEMKRAGHLFGEIKGNKGKKILLIGHLDTVFEPSENTVGFERKDSIAFGPGAGDMKGGDMIMLFALKALHKANLLGGTQIIVAYHGDEESPGWPFEISRRVFVEAAKRSDIALGFEASTEFEFATIGRRGNSGWRLSVTGNQGHSSQIFTPEVGAGAIYESARILHRFYDELQEVNLTYNPNIIAGGSTLESRGRNYETGGKVNVVADTTIVTGDLRFISETQKENARVKMREIVRDHLPGTSSEISFVDVIPAMEPTEGNMRLLEMLDRVSIDLGLGEVKPLDPAKRGAADISFIAELIDGIDGLGAVGKDFHAPDESVDLATLDEQIKRAALLIYRLTKEKADEENR